MYECNVEEEPPNQVEKNQINKMKMTRALIVNKPVRRLDHCPYSIVVIISHSYCVSTKLMRGSLVKIWVRARLFF